MQLGLAKILQPLKIKFTFYEAKKLENYFSIFRLKCYLLLIISPFGLAVSSYLFTASFDMISIDIGIVLFLVGLLLLVPWTLVPALFLFTTSRPKTWQRLFSWGYVGILLVSLASWVYYFN